VRVVVGEAQAALAIRRASPGVGVLILSHHVRQRYAEELLEGGTSGVGCLLKQRVTDVESFCADARRVAAGGTVLDPEVVSVMLDRAYPRDPLARLTSLSRAWTTTGGSSPWFVTSAAEPLRRAHPVGVGVAVGVLVGW
jgi:DNA-binding NarL/FixJ family response regulator